MVLISVHIPKTAGSSFSLTLKDVYGAGLLRDYDDRPIHSPPSERRAKALRDSLLIQEQDFSRIECIHGHFLPRKYRPLIQKKSTVLVTWMRDPVERLASNYHHWKRWGQSDQGSPLVRRFIDEHWSFERFCFASEFRNLCSQFLWETPFERFDFVGIMEHYAEDMGYFSRTFLNTPTAVYRCNINDKATGGIYVTEPSLRAEIESYHAVDMALYRQAICLREARLPRDWDSVADHNPALDIGTQRASSLTAC
jgi:hypothetical protein